MNPQHQSTIRYYEHNEKRYFERTHRRLEEGAIRAFCKRLPLGAKLLDAGCGTGRDLRFFNRAGYDAEGFDASEKMAALARAQSGCRVWRADLMMLTLPKEAYDGIWASGVMSHLPAPGCQRAMVSFFAALKPGGSLFVSITEGEGEEDDQTDDPAGPVRRIYKYQAENFASLIRQSGFHVLEQGSSALRPDQIAFIARRI